MNKKEKFLLNKFEKSVNIKPDYSKISNKIVIKETKSKKNKFNYNFNVARTVLASLLLIGIIAPVTFIIDEKINDHHISSTEATPSLGLTINPSEESNSNENIASSYENLETTITPNNPGSSWDDMAESSTTLTITIEGTQYYLYKKYEEFFNKPSDETLESVEVITVDQYYVYLTLMLAYDYQDNVWYKIVQSD